MTLAPVAVGDPHASAHNAERNVINQVSELLATLEQTVSNLQTSLATEVSTARNAANLTEGLVPEDRIPTSIARAAQVAIDISTAVSSAIDAVIDGAPGALDTLLEISERLSDDSDALAALVAQIAAEAALARDATNLTSGEVPIARIPATIARSADVTSAISTSETGQVRDGDTAGGVLSGTYPNPGFAADMATQTELDSVNTAHGTRLTALESAPLSPIVGNRIATGFEVVPRELCVVNTSSLPVSTAKFVFFTAPESRLVTDLATYCGSVAAVGQTLAKMGLYSVDSNGDGTLMAMTANDTTLWGVANARYQRALTSSQNVVKGSRYAFGLISVGATTLAQLPGQTPSIALTVSTSLPRLSGQIASSSDLPSSFTNAGLANTNSRYYGELI